MMLLEKLKADGIIQKKAAIGHYSIDCPKQYCISSRVGNDKECLNLEIVSGDYAVWKCRNCLWTGHIGDKPVAPVLPSKEPESPSKPVQSPGKTEFNESVIKFLADKGITPDLAHQYCLSWDDERKAIKFPYFIGKDIVNAMLMSFPSGDTRLASSKTITFYGIEKVNAETNQIIITQREIDRIILESCGFTNVISLPNSGVLPRRPTDSYENSQDDFEYFAQAADILLKMKKVFIAVDNTPEGEKFRYEIARRVGAARCHNVTFSSKNIGETFLNAGVDALCFDINSAMPYPITGLYQVADFEASLLKHFEGGMKSGVSTGWPNVDTLFTVMPCEATVISGVPNNGKSEWLDDLSVNLSQSHNWRFAVFSPENGKEIHVIKLSEKRVGMSASPASKHRMSIETFASGFAWVNDHYFFIVGDDEKDLPTLDWILEKAAAAILRYGVHAIIIDPWNEIEHVRAQGDSETDYISKALSKIKRFNRNHGTHIFIVAHPNKMQTDKNGNPSVPSLYDISGSAHWANKMDNGIIIHRSTAIDDATEVWVKKVRFKHVGKRGMTKLKYNTENGRYAPLDEPEAKERTVQEALDFYDNEVPDMGIQVYEAD